MSARARRLWALAAVGSSVGLGLSFWPSGPYLLIWICLVPHLLLAREASGVQAVFGAWGLGVVSWVIAVYWFVPIIGNYIPSSPAIQWTLFGLLCIYHGLVFVVAILLMLIAAKRLRVLGIDHDGAVALASVPAIVFAEAYFPKLFPGSAALTQADHLPAIQCLELGGMAAIAWIITTVNAFVFLGIRALTSDQPSRRRAAACFGAALAIWGANELYGHLRIRAVDRAQANALAEDRAVSVLVMQPNIAKRKRIDYARYDRNNEIHSAVTDAGLKNGAVDLVLWPHNTYRRRIYFEADDPDLKHPRIDGLSAEDAFRRDIPQAAHVLVGAEADVRDASGVTLKRYFVGLLKGPDGEYLGAAAKRFPTPLLDFVPFGNIFPFLNRLLPYAYKIAAGPQPVLSLQNGVRIGIFICYDTGVAAAARDLTAAGAQILVNPTSDQWSMDKKIQPLQHLRFAVIRAVASRRVLVRATSSAISAAIDPTGRVVGRMRIDERGSFRVRVPLMDGIAPAVRLGEWPYRVAGLLLIGFCAAPLFLNRRRGN
ncbi:MAG: apolipoprotein N-acyltransferase [Elusimicrobia bacterium]|nr:MAG: apolipoprotein N-acyltransferase [Elusimicrobiota bacterium]